MEYGVNVMRKKQHLIAIDLDGTLLTDNKQISTHTKRMINHVISEGHIVVIATGREKRLSIDYYDELGLTTPIINSNGAVLHHPLDKNWGNYHTPLKHQTAIDIIDICYELQSKNILATVYDSVFLDRYDQRIVDFYRPSENDASFQIGKIKDQLKEDPTLMLLYPNIEQVDLLTTQLDTLHTEVITHRNWGEPFHIIEIMSKGMNKAESLKIVADYYQIPRERIIAFGDEGNDFEMIEYAGIGVAMDNAIDELKTIAKHVTDTNEANGVASFLQNYFKIMQTTY